MRKQTPRRMTQTTAAATPSWVPTRSRLQLRCYSFAPFREYAAGLCSVLSYVQSHRYPVTAVLAACAVAHLGTIVQGTSGSEEEEEGDSDSGASSQTNASEGHATGAGSGSAAAARRASGGTASTSGRGRKSASKVWLLIQSIAVALYSLGMGRTGFGMCWDMGGMSALGSRFDGVS